MRKSTGALALVFKCLVRFVVSTLLIIGRTTLTSFFDTTTNLWLDAFLAGRGGDLTIMTTATTMAGERVDSDEDNNTTKTAKAR